MNDVKVLVGIVTRNRAQILAKAISSALAQDVERMQVAVVDDGSADRTPEVRRDFPEVRWARWEENRGLMAARNYLMQSSTEDFFVSLDDDACFLNGDEISVGVSYLEAHPTVAAIAFDILSPDKSIERSRSQPRRVSMFIGCGHIIRLGAARAAGGYVSTPGMYGSEEKDLALRLMDAGYEIMLLPGVHVWHDKSAVAREQPAQHRSGVCNDLAMTLRRTPLVVLPLALLWKLYRHFRFSRANQLEKQFWGGVRLFCLSIPQVWRTRRPVRLPTLRAYVKLSREESAVNS